MTRFRPCIDLHAGQVKQIVGGTLTTNDSELKTNYVSKYSAGYYAELYKETTCLGAHVIMLGPGNSDAAREALVAWPGKLQVGGGITDENAQEWIEAGAEKVIITSFLFPNGGFSLERLRSVLHTLKNDKEKLVIDLSCRRRDDTWFVAMNKWQTITTFEITKENLTLLTPYTSELLIHAADHEGLQAGVDIELISRLAEWCPTSISITYAGGARTIEDLELVKSVSGGRVDLTIGSALDVFGGKGAKFEDCVAWNRRQDELGQEKESKEGDQRGEE